MQNRENNQNCRQQKEKQTSDSRENRTQNQKENRPVCEEQGRKAASFSPLLFPFPCLPAERSRDMMCWKSHCRRIS